MDSEVLIDFIVCSEELGLVVRFDGVGFDEVGIYNVEKHNVIVFSVGCNGKTAGLIGE